MRSASLGIEDVGDGYGRAGYVTAPHDLSIVVDAVRRSERDSRIRRNQRVQVRGDAVLPDGRASILKADDLAARVDTRRDGASAKLQGGSKVRQGAVPENHGMAITEIEGGSVRSFGQGREADG